MLFKKYGWFQVFRKVHDKQHIYHPILASSSIFSQLPPVSLRSRRTYIQTKLSVYPSIIPLFSCPSPRGSHHLQFGVYLEWHLKILLTSYMWIHIFCMFSKCILVTLSLVCFFYDKQCDKHFCAIFPRALPHEFFYSFPRDRTGGLNRKSFLSRVVIANYPSHTQV